MPMNKLFAIVFALVLPALLFCGCSDEEDILPDQRQKIVSFLEGTHTPRLIAESAVDPESQSPYYSMSGSTVYRYISTVYDPERPGRAEVTSSSLATVTFRMYVFTYAAIPDTRLPEFSNDETLRQAYVDAKLDVSAWPFQPLVVDMRGGGILKGLSHALLGCRMGDEVEAYMTYNMAYGDGYFSIIPKESPVMIRFTVNNVE